MSRVPGRKTLQLFIYNSYSPIKDMNIVLISEVIACKRLPQKNANVDALHLWI